MGTNAFSSTLLMRGNGAPVKPPPKHMVWIPGGTFLMGSNDHYPEERPGPSRHGRRLLDGPRTR